MNKHSPGSFHDLSEIKEVAVGILFRDRHILVCQRRRTVQYPLKWEFPGGKLEPHESPQDALTRELKEELGITARVGAEFHRQEWVYPETKAGSGTFRVYYYKVASFEGEPRNRAFEDIRWVAPPQLKALDILDGNREAVDLLVKHDQEREEV